MKRLLIAAITALSVCSCAKHRTIDRLSLAPGQNKEYAFVTEKPMSIGLLLDHDVEGGVVKLVRLGAVGSAGTGSYWVSREWEPKEGRILLRLENQSASAVEVTVFEGREPNL
jgi:hypothetical protein